MTDREAIEFSPSNEELQVLYNGILSALEINPRLNVYTKEHRDRFLRVFRLYVFGGIEAELILGETEYDEIEVEARSAPDNEYDPNWVSIRIQKHADQDGNTAMFGDPKALVYTIDKKPPYDFDVDPVVYTLEKRLPLLDEADPVFGTTSGMTAEDSAFAKYIEQQARAIVPKDMQLLERLAVNLSE